MKSLSLENIVNGIKESKNFLQRNLSPKGIATLGIVGFGSPSLAQSGERYVNFDADPLVMDVNRGPMDMTQWRLSIYSTDTPDEYEYVLENAKFPQNGMKVMDTFTVPDAGTANIDGVGAPPYLRITEGENLGSLGPFTEIPGTEPGQDTIYEVDSSLRSGLPYFFILGNGTKVAAFNNDGTYFATEKERTRTSVEKWNVEKHLVDWTEFYGNTETPEGWAAGQKKVYRQEWVISSPTPEVFDMQNATVTYRHASATEATTDEETFSLMLDTYYSPYPGVTISPIPETYRNLQDILNNSVIRDENDNKKGFFYLGDNNTATNIPSMYGPNYPSPDESRLVQRDYLNADGSINTVISSPPVADEVKSFGDVKAMRYSTATEAPQFEGPYNK